jgi:hypothetical protein
MSRTNYRSLKLITLVIILTVFANQLLAQSGTTGIFFQAVARDNYSNPAKERKIYVQSSIIQTTINGTSLLVEEHQVNTDGTGMFSISIGNGTRVGGAATGLNAIDWSQGPFYLNLKIAITPVAGNTGWDYKKEWVDIGTTSFGAVPYALYSANAGGVNQKLSITDTTKMLAVYAKSQAVQTLSTTVDSKLSAKDTLTMLAPYARAAYVLDSAYIKAQLKSKLNIADSSAAYVTPKALNTAVLNLQPAAVSNSGIVTNKAQTFGGLKTFNNGINYTKVSSSATLDQSNTSSNAGAGGISQWQSFTAGINGILSSVEWKMASPLIPAAAAPITVKIYNGEGSSGTLLASVNDSTPSTWSNVFVSFDLSSSEITVKSGQLYTIELTTPAVQVGWLNLSTSNSYATGRGSNDTTWDYVFKTYVKSTSVDSYLPLSGGSLTGNLITSGTLTTGAVTYPKVDGSNGQVLTTNGAGVPTWTTPSSGIPYTGASSAVNLGAYDLTVNSLTIGLGKNGIDNNVAIGQSALSSTTKGFQGNYLTAVGYEALKTNTWGYFNTAIGSSALFSNTTGLANTSIGSNSLLNNTVANFNTAVGTNALRNNTTGENNTASGASSLENNTTGEQNSAFGRNTLSSNTTGSINTATGLGALSSNTTGGANTANGVSALNSNIVGGGNTAMGNNALRNTNASENTAIGNAAGIVNTTGTNNTAIGGYADFGANNLTNATAIGNQAIVTASNTIQLGNTSVTNVKTSGTLTAGGLVLKTAIIDVNNANNYDVTGIGIFFINSDLSYFDIYGFSGGVIGQVIQLVNANTIGSPSNGFRLIHNDTRGTQKFANTDNRSIDVIFGSGGITIVFDGTYWRALKNPRF